MLTRMTADYDATIRAIVDAAPPLTDAQRDKLAVLLDDGGTAQLNGAAA